MSRSMALEDLARQALDGDRDAVDRLVRDLQGDVYGLAIRMLWNREDAEDATQEILVRVVTRLSQFDFRSRLRTWVYRVAVNYLLAQWAGASTAVLWGGIEAWRWMYLMQAVPAAGFLVALQFIPESPRYLVAAGIEATRLEAVGLGGSQPAADNDTPGGRSANRRVELHIVKSAPP